MPEKISKLPPAKVINSGIALSRNTMYKTTSTGIRTMLINVSDLRSRLSINRLPFLVRKSKIIVSNTGAVASMNLGGIVEVSV